MAEEINVSCPGCNCVFNVPVEYCGETAECAECGVMFEIPAAVEKPDAEFKDTDTGPVKGVESKDVADTTNTVKLSRSGIGMIPDIKDSFPFATDVPPPAPKKSASSSRRKRSNKAEKAVILPAWIKLDLKAGEKVSAFAETGASAFNAPAMIAAVVVLAGLIAIITVRLSNVYLAFVCVFIIAAAAFAGAFSMLAKKRRQALVVTDQRAVYKGEKDLEVKL